MAATDKGKTPKPSNFKSTQMLSTGATLLNLAITGNPFYGLKKGHYYYLVGDSSSGKTFISLTQFAEAHANVNFANHRFIYDDAENGALMNMRRFFGKGAAARIEPPRLDKDGLPVFSVTVEDFYDNLHAALAKGPCIYVLDSMDVLDVEADLAKESKARSVRENRRAGKQPKEEAGNFGVAKAKVNSTKLRPAVNALKKNGSILIIISQTRQQIGGMPSWGGPQKTRGGGLALTFYATCELWSSVKEKIKKKVRGKMRIQGAVTQVQVKKNRQTGRDRKILLPFYNTLGFDDTGGCVDYLLEEAHWKKGQGGIRAPEFDFNGSRDELIAHIEAEGHEDVLRVLVAKVWNEVEAETAVERKARY